MSSSKESTLKIKLENKTIAVNVHAPLTEDELILLEEFIKLNSETTMFEYDDFDGYDFDLISTPFKINDKKLVIRSWGVSGSYGFIPEEATIKDDLEYISINLA